MPIDFPANPTNGQVYGNWIYDSSITAWRNVNTDTGIGTLNAMGLKNVVPGSVAVASGSATTNSNGTVTFTGVSSISINNVYASAYEKFRVNIKVLSSANNIDLFWQNRAANSNYAINYFGAGMISTYSGSYGNTNPVNNGSRGWLNVMSSSSNNHSSVEVIPAAGNTSFTNTAYTPYASAIILSGYESPTATKPDGFTLYSASGTFSGTINVYGYTN